MSTVPWPTVPGVRVHLRFGKIGADGPDPDAKPRLVLPGTEVVLTPDIDHVEYQGVVAPPSVPGHTAAYLDHEGVTQ